MSVCLTTVSLSVFFSLSLLCLIRFLVCVLLEAYKPTIPTCVFGRGGGHHARVRMNTPFFGVVGGRKVNERVWVRVYIYVL